MKDSIFGLDVADRVASYQIKYETEKKENLMNLNKKICLNRLRLILETERSFVLDYFYITLLYCLFFGELMLLILRRNRKSYLTLFKNFKRRKERITYTIMLVDSFRMYCIRLMELPVESQKTRRNFKKYQ